MTRNLKALGLALIAALTLGAIGAQGAAAVVEHSYRSDATNETTVLTGQSESDYVFEAGTGGAKTICTSATFSGTQTPKGNIRDTITLHPIYTSCKLGTNSVTVTTGGCNYVLDSETTAGSHFSGEHATVSVECESTHDIQIDGPGCNITKKGNTVNQSLHGVHLTTLSSAQSHSGRSAITISKTVGKIHYETKGGLACTAIGKPEGTYTDGITKGAFSVTGYEDNTGVPATSSTTIGTTWHHSQQVNIAVSTPT